MRSSDHRSVYHGRFSPPVADADSGDTVSVADFSAVTAPGRYYLEAPGVGRSWEFFIDAAVYQRPYYLSARSYYGQRCGTAVDLGPEFAAFRHAPCHLAGEYDASTGKTGRHASSYGWHDAGDYGRYVVNAGISTGTLLWAQEMFGSKLSKIPLAIPETGRTKAPDLLSEARWNVEWMLTMQDGDGGVFHKQTSTHFSGFVMPEKDALPSGVIGTGSAPFKSSCATGDFAAVLAITSRLYRPIDAAYADRTLEAAEEAWRWLENNSNVTFHNPAGVATGEYGDGDCSDERLWAAAELWRTTREETYSRYFVAQYGNFLKTLSASTPPSWANVAPLALWSYALGKGADGAALTAIRERSLSAARELVEQAARNPYRHTLVSRDYIWGSNSVVGNQAMQLLVANAMAPDPRFVQTAMENVHYLFGRNTFSLSWVTQVGQNAFQHPHHRPSVADGVDAPWPGLLSGGPNKSRQDPIAQKQITADTPPARCYVDDAGAYAVNEVAINWNAPLVFTLAALLPE